MIGYFLAVLAGVHGSELGEVGIVLPDQSLLIGRNANVSARPKNLQGSVHAEDVASLSCKFDTWPPLGLQKHCSAAACSLIN